MAKIDGMQALIARLGDMSKRASQEYGATVIVGYTQQYALYVHENLTAQHKTGQAKFLEQPAREHAREIGALIKEAYEKGSSFEQALLIGGLRLQRESMKLVPIDTGALRASAFTRIEKV